MKKLSFIAMAVATALVGCGGDDSSSNNNGNNGNTAQKAEKPVIAIPAQGKFIDAKIEGLHYISGSKQGFTNTEGQYDIDANIANVTFILGGEINGDVDGLVIGNVSSRHITTPFEAAGTFQRSINLARLLLTINDNANDQLIVIPEAIKTPDAAMVSALKRITLDDIETSSVAVLEKLGKTSADLITAEEAQKHLVSSLGQLTRGSNDKLTHWAKGSNWAFVERSARQRIRNSAGSDYDLVIHADRSLGDDVFKNTVGLAGQTFTLADSDFIVHKGSNDSTVSGNFAAQYLTCVKKNGIFSWSENDEPLCNDEEIITIDPALNGIANGNGHYQLVVTDPTMFSTEEVKETWNEMVDMVGAYACMANATCSEQTLTKFEVITRDDSDAQDGSQMQKETMSGSYDPITDVYVQTRSKEYLNGKHIGRVEEAINFIYPVEAVGQDRYVDFIGTWRSVMTEPGCDEVAVATYTFDANGLTTTGQELNGNGSGCYLEGLNETVSYQELANMDYWWFTTNTAGASKATLDQLNTTIRWNDRDAGDTVDNFKINRFSYIPAGKNWDRGVLVRDTLDSQGNKVHTQTLTKISQ
ncbi:chromosome partitioning protein ParA [Vibrio mimicus]|uniref:chromosome partitioning protein ParA n=1 Tax=Vibrio mimicus TaxID=674 RepID=UPI0011D3491F|nr:chromosome partitioning protein ParA [Vibrio mimicus]TXY13330.1 chromosome partitioning protein ParA [Vibrio mimicus]